MKRTKRRQTHGSLSESPAHTGTQFRRIFFGAIAIAILATIAYWPSLHGGFQWDDDDLLTENSLVKAPDGLSRIWFSTEAIDYWPIFNSSFWIEWRLFGNDPTGYHVVSVLLHIANAWLVWAVLRRVSSAGAFLAALLFAVHPVNVESVAWISQRKNTLSMGFFLLAMLWHLQAEAGGSAGSNGRESRWRWLSVAAFTLAMLSKGSVAILPLVLLLLAWWRRGEITRADLVRSAPYFAVSGILTIVNLWFRTHGASDVFREATFAERLAGAGAILWFYLWKALVPINLTFVYPLWKIDVSRFVWWLPLIAALLVTFGLWRGRAQPWCRAVLVAWLYFAICLLPVLGFTDANYVKYSLVADHYQYLSVVGVCALVAAGVDRMAQAIRGRATSVSVPQSG